MKRIIAILFCLLYTTSLAEEISIMTDKAIACIENEHIKVEFQLKTGQYSLIDQSDKTSIIKNARFLLDPGTGRRGDEGGVYKAEIITDNGQKVLRCWYKPTKGYFVERFLDFSLSPTSNFLVIGWGIAHPKPYPIRIKQADVLYKGQLLSGQEGSNPQNLKGGAGAEPNFVTPSWYGQSLNNWMLSYEDRGQRRTLVLGGEKYAEFYRHIICEEEAKEPKITLSILDSYGKLIPAHTDLWQSKDRVYIDIATKNPILALEQYGQELAKANKAKPNPYNFPTLCGWLASHQAFGEGKAINNSKALVEQVKIAEKAGLMRYTSLAVRLEPDYYCYFNYGDTQQGWWDDAHWAKYGSLVAPYESFKKFAEAVKAHGGRVFTYFQTSMPSVDFALAHPQWMLNNDISAIHIPHKHHRPLVRYDYTDPEFQAYVLHMWQGLHDDGVEGIKFDYPETAWAYTGGFEDPSYTTSSAYRLPFALCRQGLGEHAFIHERNLGGATHEDVPRTDIAAGIVDIQRVWGDSSHFEPEMASRMGLRWYKQGKVFRYYPDGKSFFLQKKALSPTQYRSFLTLIGLLSGRIELGTSIGTLNADMLADLSKLYPVLPNGQSFRPLDLLVCPRHPEIYTYDVRDDWKQLILTNANSKQAKTLSVKLSGDPLKTHSLGLKEETSYLIYDFWGEKYLGSFSSADSFEPHLAAGEARVYSLKTRKNHPQILGTNRHIMCGMFELQDEEFHPESKTLTFQASIEPNSQMSITLHCPKEYQISKAHAQQAHLSYQVEGETITLQLTNKDPKQKLQDQITLSFTSN